MERSFKTALLFWACVALVRGKFFIRPKGLFSKNIICHAMRLNLDDCSSWQNIRTFVSFDKGDKCKNVTHHRQTFRLEFCISHRSQEKTLSDF